MSSSTTRLHITPLNPDLLHAVLGPTLSAYAKTVSYHHIQTAPENDFGYIELPVMDAEKVKKKLNGAILKGQKLKVEEARPSKRTFASTEEASSEAHPSSSRRSKKSKLDLNVLPAHELSPDRKVKRGWTESKEEKVNRKKKDKSDKDKSTKEKKKSQAPSKYSENAELLFRTEIPANKVSEERKEKRKKDKKSRGADVIHEFEKTTAMPSFLRNDAGGGAGQAVEYKDGKGWLDKDGNVVEGESSKASKKRTAAKTGLEIDITKAQASSKQTQKQTPPSPPSSQPSSVLHSSTSLANGQVDDETSSSGSSSPSSSSSSSPSQSEDESSEEDRTEEKAEIETQPSTKTEAVGVVHPLEAIFKKPKIPNADTPTASNSNPLPNGTSPSNGKQRPSLELSTSFSFFGPSADDEDDQAADTTQRTPHANDISHNLLSVPMTPFSSQDYRFRQIRSAAPTPDTADIRKSTGYGSLILGEDDPDDILSDGEDNDDDASAADKSKVTSTADGSLNSQGLPQSEFEKKFWEKRGENNRAWKARRRAVLKEQRQRDNRARRPQAF